MTHTQMMNRDRKQALLVFMVAFAIRLVATFVTTISNLNPSARADATGFAEHGSLIARGISEGEPYRYTAQSVEPSQILTLTPSAEIYHLWGTFLAPFWLLPGPSWLYARLMSALLGAIAIYNVYAIARHYHSHRAGVIAVIPLLFYPSMVAVHSTVLRDAFVLFCLTTATRLLICPFRRRSYLLSVVFAGGFLHLSLLMRDDNLYIYAVALLVAGTVYTITSKSRLRRTFGLGLVGVVVAFVMSRSLLSRGVDFLAKIREQRASGRGVYLPDVIPQSVIELIAFSWIGAGYFLYAPFPWMVERVPDLIVSLEGVSTAIFTIASIWGIRFLSRKQLVVTVGLLSGLAAAVVLYGVGTVNYGTAMRHRQMFTWVIFLFGGLAIADYVEFRR